MKISSALTGLFFRFCCVSCLWLAGCAGSLERVNLKNKGPAFRDPKMSLQDASEAITVGKSIKADVAAALGNAAVIQFDSGYEVWVYWVKSGESAFRKAEFVVLFAPSGVVKKIRIRPPV